MANQLYSCVLRCFNGCENQFPVTQPIYKCPNCQGLLDVHHDVNALSSRTAAEWIDIFDRRPSHATWPHNSGVWSKKEWVLPTLESNNIVSMGEGNSALVLAQRYGNQIGIENLLIKQSGTSHSGSFKDLGMTVLVSVVKQAVCNGLKVRAIACASTGDTSAALAAYGAAAGFAVVVLLPRGKISMAQLVQPIASGATVLSLDTDFDGCMRIVDQLAQDGLVYLANSMNAIRIEGQKTVAIEMVQQLGWNVPDWVVLPSGNLGNAYAIYSGFELMRQLKIIQRLPRLAIAQSENANPIYLAWKNQRNHVDAVVAKPTLATAIQIGNPVSAPRAMKALQAMNGVVEQASEQELCDAAARADRAGLYTCPHTAVALACLEKLARSNIVRHNETVVVVSTASGLKFTEFKLQYHKKNIPQIDCEFSNSIIELPANYDHVAKMIETTFGTSPC